MAQQVINIGTAPNGAGGDTNRSSWVKANDMFSEVYGSGFVLGAAQEKALSSPNTQPLGTVKAYTGYDSQATEQGWPVIDNGNSGLPVWWNIQCIGSKNRESQIAIQAYDIGGQIGRSFSRSRHDNTWGSWKELTNNVLRTSNGNGTALRYPDGTLICYRNTTGSVQAAIQVGNVFVSSSIGFTFPEAFIDIPSISPYAITPGAAISWGAAEGSAQVNGFTARLVSITQNSNSYVGYIAIGRWK